MSDTQTGVSVIIQQTPPKNNGRADFNQGLFDTTVWDKGYNVYIDKGLSCPCRNTGDSQALTACRNCGGSGFIFINRTKTKAVIQAMNIESTFKEWSFERKGTAKITVINDNKLSFMDRITLIDATSNITQLVKGKLHSDNKYRGMVTYPIKEIEAAFIFVDENTPLTHAIEGTHFTVVDGNWIEFANGFETVTMTLRYKHNPMYYIEDETRTVMTTIKAQSGKEELQQMPLSAIGRAAHYVLNQQKFNTAYLFNNNFIPDECGIVIKEPCS